MVTLANMTDLQRITDNLAILMEETGLDNQSKLARASGLSQTNLSNIMRHAVSPTLETLGQLAKALRVETWQLLAPPDPTRLLRLYTSASPLDRDMLLRVAESLARYHPDANE